jgi:hypothetical protein
MRSIVLVFDICSSTTIIEDLAKNDRVRDFGKLADGIWGFLSYRHRALRFTIYKFLGDGFILLFENRQHIDEILNFCTDLAFFCEQLLAWFIDRYLDVERLPRQGITAGLTDGSVWPINTLRVRNEYVGRPISLACRLQGALTEPKDINTTLLQASLRKSIASAPLRTACTAETMVLRNISNQANIKCLRYDMEPSVKSKWGSLRGRPVRLLKSSQSKNSTLRGPSGMALASIVTDMIHLHPWQVTESPA